MTENSEHRIRVLTKKAEALSRMAEHTPGIEDSISKRNANEAAYEAWKDVFDFWELHKEVLEIELDELDLEGK